MTRRRRLLWLTAALLGFTVLLCGWTVESMMLHGGPAALPQAGRPLAGNDGGPATAPTGRPARPPVRPRPRRTGGVTPVVLEPPPSAPATPPAVPVGGG
ncbi:MAG: hypothetical protein H7233_04665, partial [Pseudorhodobacter sp.]|nr:hypothetical protein [Frankiaceae bacterium]